VSTLARCTFTIILAASFVAGCGGSQPSIGAPGVMQQRSGAASESAAVTRATLHRVLPASYYRVLYRFRHRGGNGAQPSASLLNVNGTLYGTTEFGGSGCASGCGTVFSVTTTGRKVTLYRFQGGNSDGAQPAANLINVHGTLYGTTLLGGTANGGTVYSVSTTGSEKVLHSFGLGTDGRVPYAGLIDVNGTLYGTTSSGGSECKNYSGCGTVFSVTTTGNEKTLYSFSGSPDGNEPLAGLVNISGTLYGTTHSGGDSECFSGCGIVFSVTTTGSEKVLHSFAGGPDGANPDANVINGENTLYGTTYGGGASGYGTVFSVTTSGVEKVLYSFSGGSDGSDPAGGLIGVRGTMYGTTEYGGSGCRGDGCGTIFSVTTTGKKTRLYSFGGGNYGSDPIVSLVEVKRTLYGTTHNFAGGCRYHGDCGTVFAFTP
jgi:uncharacterized repeat protein (TIGR03803 family)